jgi:hypothetical protein
MRIRFSSWTVLQEGSSAPLFWLALSRCELRFLGCHRAWGPFRIAAYRARHRVVSRQARLQARVQSISVLFDRQVTRAEILCGLPDDVALISVVNATIL